MKMHEILDSPLDSHEMWMCQPPPPVVFILFFFENRYDNTHRVPMVGWCHIYRSMNG